ncbi:MAG: DUF992 domain-containing protein [Hyphomicrobiaceae bacterium]|jgi:hypothetical protein
MRKSTLAAAGLGLAACFAGTGASAQSRVEVGVLNCAASGTTGFVFGSTKYLRCRFEREGRDEFYRGTIHKYGLDLGATQKTIIGWAVLAPTDSLPARSLDGEYGGVGAEATLGVGVGANALLGGSNRSIVLQPLSVQAQEGLNIAAGISSLQLRAERGRR